MGEKEREKGRASSTATDKHSNHIMMTGSSTGLYESSFRNTRTHRYQACWGMISSPRCVYIGRFRQLRSAAPVCTSSSWPLTLNVFCTPPEPPTRSKQWPFWLLSQPWTETQAHLSWIPVQRLTLHCDWQVNWPITRQESVRWHFKATVPQKNDSSLCCLDFISVGSYFEKHLSGPYNGSQ